MPAPAGRPPAQRRTVREPARLSRRALRRALHLRARSTAAPPPPAAGTPRERRPRPEGAPACARGEVPSAAGRRTPSSRAHLPAEHRCSALGRLGRRGAWTGARLPAAGTIGREGRDRVVGRLDARGRDDRVVVVLDLLVARRSLRGRLRLDGLRVRHHLRARLRRRLDRRPFVVREIVGRRGADRLPFAGGRRRLGLPAGRARSRTGSSAWGGARRVFPQRAGRRLRATAGAPAPPSCT